MGNTIRHFKTLPYLSNIQILSLFRIGFLYPEPMSPRARQSWPSPDYLDNDNVSIALKIDNWLSYGQAIPLPVSHLRVSQSSQYKSTPTPICSGCGNWLYSSYIPTNPNLKKGAHCAVAGYHSYYFILLWVRYFRLRPLAYVSLTSFGSRPCYDFNQGIIRR